MLLKVVQRVFVRNAHCKKCITICKATECDQDDIKKFMRETFFKTEPSSTICGLTQKTSVSDALLNFVVQPLCENMSYLAQYEQKGKERIITGVAINGTRPTKFDEESWEESVKGIKCEQEMELLLLWKQLSRMPCNPEDYFGCAEELVELFYLSVRPLLQRQGIAKSMVLHSMHEAKCRGYCHFRMDCTSSYSACLAQKCGLHKIAEVYYKELRDSAGKRYKNIPPPHLKAAIMVANTTQGNC
ncbi:UNVERIFIED_CONTAM: hypothetical protein PYX00_005920 [Menopon gallinae]|uniref:N-acetyltransferase domain-containing protein n=1 Tax=Menopon gallinae TaxID=328185 RepID=A0AAW2HTD5_9NEOP